MKVTSFNLGLKHGMLDHEVIGADITFIDFIRLLNLIKSSIAYNGYFASIVKYKFESYPAREPSVGKGKLFPL